MGDSVGSEEKCSSLGRKVQSQARGRLALCLCLVPRYGMRYVAKVLQNALSEKFPNATEDEIYKVSSDLLPGPCCCYLRSHKLEGRVVVPKPPTPKGMPLHPGGQVGASLVCRLTWDKACTRPFDH